MLFFGTPFRGASGLNQVEMLQAIQSQYDDDQIQRSSLKILEPGNETLMDLMDLFFKTRQGRNMAHVVCFFELKPSNVGAIYGEARKQVGRSILHQIALIKSRSLLWARLQDVWIKAKQRRSSLSAGIIST